MLSDFRVAHQAALDALLTEILALMMAEGLVTLRHVAQDGMRVRASAGASSFRRQATLEKCLTEAHAQVERLAKEREHPDPGVTRREQAAREKVAQDRLRRVEAALRQLPAVQAAKDRQKRNLETSARGKVTEARVSTTDPEARVMKMPDGGFRPALNMEIASDVDSHVIVGVKVVPRGSDGGEAVPMVAQINERTEHVPGALLFDGGLATRKDITTLERQGVTIFAPSRPPKEGSERTQGEKRKGDTQEMAAWRARMETAEAKVIYRERGSTAEHVNAHSRRHGLYQLPVRGTEKVLSVLLLVAITHNLLRWIVLTH
jgi:hypothetical protein